MKQLSFAIFLISLFLVGCRQQDDVFSQDDKTNLKILNRTSTDNNTSDTVYVNSLQEGDPIPPPRK